MDEPTYFIDARLESHNWTNKYFCVIQNGKALFKASKALG